METLIMRRIQVAQVNGVSCGGLVVKGQSWHKGQTTTVYRLDEHGKEGQRFYADVSEYRAGDGKPVYAAVFPTLPPGNYKAIEPGYTSYGKTVTVFPGCLAEVTYT
jgi:hypothetical protein